jgi:hypothetical protein
MTIIKIENGGYIVGEQMESFGIDFIGVSAHVCAYSPAKYRYIIKSFDAEYKAVEFLESLIDEME